MVLLELDLGKAGRIRVNSLSGMTLGQRTAIVRLGTRSERALNDLLRFAGETGDVDQAFRRTFSRTYDEMRQEWLESLG